VHLAGALVVARVDEFDRALDDLEDREIGRRAGLQRAVLGQARDHPRRRGGDHGDDLGEREPIPMSLVMTQGR